MLIEEKLLIRKSALIQILILKFTSFHITHDEKLETLSPVFETPLLHTLSFNNFYSALNRKMQVPMNH